MGVPVRLNIRFDYRARPSADQAIWLYTGLVIVGHPIASFVYWTSMLEAGVLRPDADSVAIPIFLDVVVAMVAAIPMLALTKLALVLKDGPFRLWSWNTNRPIRSVVCSCALGGPALYLAFGTAKDLIAPWPWYAYAWILQIVAVIVWLLVLRGAALSSAGSRRARTDGTTESRL